MGRWGAIYGKVKMPQNFVTQGIGSTVLHTASCIDHYTGCYTYGKRGAIYGKVEILQNLVTQGIGSAILPIALSQLVSSS